MFRNRLVTSFAFCAVAFAAAGCNRGGDETPAAEAQAQHAQPTNQPTTVTGCLKAGEAEGTFVLTAAQTTGSIDTATYQLVGSAGGVNLQDHIGRRVEVNGTVTAAQHVASASPARPASGDKATGTSGTPTVQTRTEIEVKRLEVSAVKPLGDRCEM